MATTRRKSRAVALEEESSSVNEPVLRPRRGRKPLVPVAEEVKIKVEENGSAAAAPAVSSAPAAVSAGVAAEPAAWDKVKTRAKSTFVMIGSFFVLIYLGHMALVGLVFFLQCWIFKELLELRDKTVFRKLREDRTRYRLPILLDWFFFISSCFFMYGRIFLARFDIFYEGPAWLTWLAEHHSFISFSLYCMGFLGFVFSLEPGMYKIQFKQLVWTTMILALMVFQSSLYVHTLFEGMIWFFLPCALVVANDIWAYLIGFFFGRHPLIRLSPKKTWEGFIGGTIATYFFAIFFTWVISRWDWMTCPKEDLFSWGVSCKTDPIFEYHTYPFPEAVVAVLSKLGISWNHVRLVPMQLHALALATFASLIAPFGGFFASGFKRGLQIKDFGESIPGHGGVTDRMDCQILMGMFTYVYLTNFVRPYVDIASVLRSALALSVEDQRHLYESLGKHLQAL